MADITPASGDTNPTDLVDEKEQVVPEAKYAHGVRLTLIIVSLLLGIFLVALDNVGDSQDCNIEFRRNNTDTACQLPDDPRNGHPKDHR